MNMHVKKGDKVLVITGRDKGKQGVVGSVSKKNVLINGVNVDRFYILIEGIIMKVCYINDKNKNVKVMEKKSFPVDISNVKKI